MEYFDQRGHVKVCIFTGAKRQKTSTVESAPLNSCTFSPLVFTVIIEPLREWELGKPVHRERGVPVTNQFTVDSSSFETNAPPTTLPERTATEAAQLSWEMLFSNLASKRGVRPNACKYISGGSVTSLFVLSPDLTEPEKQGYSGLDENSIVQSTVVAGMQNPIVGPSVLRLFAHDCFVDGCDASIMLVDPAGNNERSAGDNQSLQQVSLDIINQAKLSVEQACPATVSCADIIAMAAEVVVNQMGGPSWTVLLGRKDGFTSQAANVAGHLPGSHMDLNALMAVFGNIRLGVKELVALSGAHTVGFTHCVEFSDRLYNFNGVPGATDPSLSAGYAATLQGICPNGASNPTTVQPLDPVTAAQFDNMYYQQLQIGQGLLFSDQVLYVDNSTSGLVTLYANNQGQFFNDFVNAMIAMGNAGVLTGAQGEVRLNCSVVNTSPAGSPPAPVVPSPTATPMPVPAPPTVPAAPAPAAPVVPAPVPPTNVSPPAPIAPVITPPPPVPVSQGPVVSPQPFVSTPPPPAGTS
ncbi:hypothetical protein R1flu_012299 [Riccia fluitans]|uniref:Plant heme peroxidase family profile domain-containing protein n=1 Tax=Riccia fluitans TaxID=41844 RepID=A0ABD1ZA82_9MARC